MCLDRRHGSRRGQEKAARFPGSWNGRVRWSEGYSCGVWAFQVAAGEQGSDGVLVELVDRGTAPKVGFCLIVPEKVLRRLVQSEDREIRGHPAPRDTG
jgi:hypothetical protein